MYNEIIHIFVYRFILVENNEHIAILGIINYKCNFAIKNVKDLNFCDLEVVKNKTEDFCYFSHPVQCTRNN